MLSNVTLEETKVDLSLLEKVTIPYSWSEYTYHVRSSLDLHSIIQTGLVAGGKDMKDGRQAEFFTDVNLMIELQNDEQYDVTKTRKVQHYTRWKVY